MRTSWIASVRGVTCASVAGHPCDCLNPNARSPPATSRSVDKLSLWFRSMLHESRMVNVCTCRSPSFKQISCVRLQSLESLESCRDSNVNSKSRLKFGDGLAPFTSSTRRGNGRSLPPVPDGSSLQHASTTPIVSLERSSSNGNYRIIHYIW